MICCWATVSSATVDAHQVVDESGAGADEGEGGEELQRLPAAGHGYTLGLAGPAGVGWGLAGCGGVCFLVPRSLAIEGSLNSRKPRPLLRWSGLGHTGATGMDGNAEVSRAATTRRPVVKHVGQQENVTVPGLARRPDCARVDELPHPPISHAE